MSRGALRFCLPKIPRQFSTLHYSVSPKHAYCPNRKKRNGHPRYVWKASARKNDLSFLVLCVCYLRCLLEESRQLMNGGLCERIFSGAKQYQRRPFFLFFPHPLVATLRRQSSEQATPLLPLSTSATSAVGKVLGKQFVFLVSTKQ